ncbi:MAG: class I SAM-dependent methyltransferase [Acidimicrobiales bacterium]
MNFPSGFFDRSDPETDRAFYAVPRLVTHIDDRAIAAVGALYEELGVPDGDVLDLMSSWVSHLPRRPRSLCALGMNVQELAANPMATSTLQHDLNEHQQLPFPDASFDSVLCCVSVDYLIAPLQVFADALRVLRPGGVFVCTFSNRLFPTKAIRGWLYATDSERVRIVEEYFRRSGPWDGLMSRACLPPDGPGDPLYAVWARRRGPGLVDPASVPSGRE